MDEYSEVIERLRDEGGFDDEIAVLEKFEKGSLRKQAGRSTELEARVKELEGEIAKRDEAPKRQEALQKYGIDFDALRPAEKRLLASYEGELTDEAIGALVEENDLPVVDSAQEESEEEPSDAEKIAGAARRAGSNGSGANKIEPGDIAGWSADRWVRFAEANPDAAEALRQGKTVTGVTA